LDQEFGASAVAVPVGFNRIRVEAPHDVRSLALQQLPGESFAKGQVGGGLHSGYQNVARAAKAQELSNQKQDTQRQSNIYKIVG
jgi:hypothetical protein